MLEKYTDSKVPASAIDIFDTKNFWINYNEYFKEYNFVEIVRSINTLVGGCDEIISTKKPWEKAKEGKNIDELLYQLSECLRHIGLALLPIIPESGEKILTKLGLKDNDLNLEGATAWGLLEKGTGINKGDALFPRI
jgi:methionyl-tRNA synthetase